MSPRRRRSPGNRDLPAPTTWGECEGVRAEAGDYKISARPITDVIDEKTHTVDATVHLQYRRHLMTATRSWPLNPFDDAKGDVTYRRVPVTSRIAEATARPRTSR